jgi:hypothetical protein
MRPPSLGELVEPGTEQLHDLGEQAGQGVVFLPPGVGLEERIWRVTQRTERVSEGQGKESSRLLEGSLGYGAGEAVAKPCKEQAVAEG